MSGALYHLYIGFVNQSNEMSSTCMVKRNINMNSGGGDSIVAIVNCKKGAKIGLFLYNAHSSSVTAQYIRFAVIKL